MTMLVRLMGDYFLPPSCEVLLLAGCVCGMAGQLMLAVLGVVAGAGPLEGSRGELGV